MASLDFPGGRGPALCGQGGPRALGGAAVRIGPTFRTARFLGQYVISLVTQDSVGAPLGGCDVDLFEDATDTKIASAVSDGAGAVTFRIGQNAGYFYAKATKPGGGGPDVAGITGQLTATEG